MRPISFVTRCGTVRCSATWHAHERHTVDERRREPTRSGRSGAAQGYAVQRERVGIRTRISWAGVIVAMTTEVSD